MLRETLGVILVLGGLFAGCSREEPKEEIRKTCVAVKDAVRAIYRLENAVSSGGRPRFTPLDVKDLSAAEVKAKFQSFADAANAHLWMPGEASWIIVEQANSNRVSLAAAMEAFADDAACAVALPEVFAGYVGTLAEVMPAFAANLTGTAVPEWFVTKEIPALDWLDATGVDADIAAPTVAEIRSMQVVRRLILEGNMAARRATDKKGEEEATEKWSRAFQRNPHDSLLLERIDNLARNAAGFLAVGKTLQAMKCYETIILINKNDAGAVRQFGMCLRTIGREDMAKKVLARAEALAKPRE